MTPGIGLMKRRFEKEKESGLSKKERTNHQQSVEFSHSKIFLGSYNSNIKEESSYSGFLKLRQFDIQFNSET